MRLKLPRHVHHYHDRHGKPRFYYRRTGFKRTPLPDLLWTETFMQAYEQAASGVAAVPLGAKLIRTGTVI